MEVQYLRLLLTYPLFVILRRSSSSVNKHSLPGLYQNMRKPVEGSIGNDVLWHCRLFKNSTNLSSFKLVCFVVSYRNVLLARRLVHHSRNKKGTGTKMHPAIVSGIVTGDVSVSYWPIFFLVSSNSPRSLFECQLVPVSLFLKWGMSKKRLNSSRLAIFYRVYLLQHPKDKE